MKTRMIYSSYDEDTGISHVHILTNLGIFKGKAKLNKQDDALLASNFAGCQLAEARAYIKYYKAKIKIVKEQINGLEHLHNVLKNMSSYNPNSIENRKLRHQIYIKQSEIKSLENNIQLIEQKANEYLEKRISYLDSKQENKNNS